MSPPPTATLRRRVPRLSRATLCFAAASLLALAEAAAPAPVKGTASYPEPIARYFERLYTPAAQPLAYRADYPGGFTRWQRDARAALRTRLGLDRIATSVGDHRPAVELGAPEDHGDYTRRRGLIETEPGVRIPFWLLQPKRAQPWPLGVFPHGHDRRGHDTSAGIYADAAHERKSLEEDRDVAVQAVKRGFLAIAPATRGISTHLVPDLDGRHGDRECRSQTIHCLLAGRTAIGERVWDMQRLLDWALGLPGVDRRHVLLMGNSGGGMVTMFAAAADERISVAVPSCSFAASVSASGYVFHCDCNLVPGLMDLGGLTGVVGLIAPRHALAINGRKDPLFSPAEVDRAAAQVRLIYQDTGAAARFQHRWGSEGHRFYQDLMWPFVFDAITRLGP